MKPPTEIIELLNHISTEIGAGKSFGVDPTSVTWNAAHDRALSIIRSYKEGNGLFHLTAAARRRKEKHA